MAHRGRIDVGAFQDARETHTVQDKIITKVYLNHHGIATPESLATLLPGAALSDKFLDGMPEKFVIKPSRGAQGMGIYILTRLNGEMLEPDGKVCTKDEMMGHIRELLVNKWSVIVEKAIEPHSELAELSPYGTMPDFRFHFAGNKLLFALMRVPTRKSRGYGNVYRGAILLIADNSGIIGDSPYWLKEPTVHPDTGFEFRGTKVPMWEEMLPQVAKVPPLFNSRLVGVDGVLDVNGRFVVPEVTLSPSFTTFTGWDYICEELERASKPRVAVPVYQFKP